jgi:membrane carboxypeptidase/penicillin-binding protein
MPKNFGSQICSQFYSLPLGSNEVTRLKYAAAYAVFDNTGILQSAHLYI